MTNETYKILLVWEQALEPGVQKPEFLNVNLTSRYMAKMEPQTTREYDIYCAKVWGQVESLIAQGFIEHPSFISFLDWVVAYHYAWLDCNQKLFRNEQFWNVIIKVREKPTLFFEYHALPATDYGLEWNKIAENYQNLILSPLASEMTDFDESGTCRNLLINYLESVSSTFTSEHELVDFGCGPGGLIPFLPTSIKRVTLIDKFDKSLQIAASQLATRPDIQPSILHEDILTMSFGGTFDYALSSNSILPTEASHVPLLFSQIAQSLKIGGIFLAILPSFDTIEYLHTLWRNYYLDQGLPPTLVSKVSEALATTKKMDPKLLQYADDGETIQTYHTPSTIKKNLKNSGLQLLTRLEKVYYPWELTKKFDYGYFPDAKEEIWDWFVVAQRTS